MGGGICPVSIVRCMLHTYTSLVFNTRGEGGGGTLVDLKQGVKRVIISLLLQGE